MRRLALLLPFLAACGTETSPPIYFVTWDDAPIFVGREVFTVAVILAILAIGAYAERKKG